MDAAEAHRFRDKAHMKDVLREHDLPCARHALARSPEEALAFADRVLPLVAKPPAGAGARDTFRVDAREQLASWVRAVPPSPVRPLLLEEFVQGREHSFDSISVGGRHAFHSISVYAPTPLEVARVPGLQWTVLLPRSIDGPEYAAIRSAGPKALDALGMFNGMTHMEWLQREDGSSAISEVAARPPGAQFTSLISLAHDRDFYSAWADVSVFERFEPPERVFSAGALDQRGHGGERVVDLHGLERAQRELGELVVEAQLPKKGQPRSSGSEGEGYVLLRHPETRVVADGLARLAKILRVELGGAS
jgi:biotin carboxylase